LLNPSFLRGFSALLGRTVAFALLAAPAGAAAGPPKTDVVVLLNGDRFTGEIMGMSRATLDLKTDDAGRISIEWTKVARVTSPHVFEVETSDGDKYHSALSLDPGTGDGSIRLDDGKSIPILDVVSIVPIDTSVWRRLQAYLDLGFTLAKANSATTLTADGEVGYRGERLGTSLEFDVYAQKTASSVAVSREAVVLSGDLYFRRWALQVFAGAEHNDELDLQLRLTVGSGVEYWALRNQSMELTARVGLAGLQEKYTSGDPTLYLTSYVTAAWDAFRYDSPKLDAGISMTAYPYLTDLGRVRLETAARVKYEIFQDFNVGLSVSDTFDSRPPDPSASNNDFLVTLTIGWSYRR
jgi:Protein of unknown function, DUF481